MDRSECGVHMCKTSAVIACAASLMACQHSGQPPQTFVPSAFSSVSPVRDSKIAFISNRDQLPEPKTFEPTELYLMNGNGSDQRCLTRTDWNEGAPDWSPHGTRIVFHGNKLCGAPWTGPCNKSGLFLMK